MQVSREASIHVVDRQEIFAGSDMFLYCFRYFSESTAQ